MEVKYYPCWGEAVFEIKINDSARDVRHDYKTVKKCFDIIFKQFEFEGFKNDDEGLYRDGEVIRLRGCNGTIFASDIIVKVFKKYSIDLDVTTKKNDDTFTIYNWTGNIKHYIKTSIV